MLMKRLLPALVALGSGITGAQAQSGIEQQIQNNNRALDRMIQEQGQSRQQQNNDAGLRFRIEQNRNLPPDRIRRSTGGARRIQDQ